MARATVLRATVVRATVARATVAWATVHDRLELCIENIVYIFLKQKTLFSLTYSEQKTSCFLIIKEDNQGRERAQRDFF